MKPLYSTILKSTKTGISNYVFANYTITDFGIGYLTMSTFRNLFINIPVMEKYTENLPYQDIKALVKFGYALVDKDEKMMLQLALIVANCKSDLSDLKERLQKVVYDGVVIKDDYKKFRDETMVEIVFISQDNRTKGSYIIQLKRNH